MKVLQVTERYPPAIGGVETHVFRLSQELRKLGVEVRVLTTDLYSTSPLVRFDQKSDDEEFVTRIKGYRALPLPQGLGVVAPGMLGQIRETSIVHVHSYGHFPTYLARYCQAARLPVVATTHSDAGRPSIKKSLFDSIIPLASIKSAQRIIAISNHESEVLIKRGIPPDRIVVIPNGIDADEFAIISPSGKSKSKILMYAGRIDIDQKGLDLLIEAFARLLKDYPDLELVLTGPDWNGSTGILSQLAMKLGISEKVHFTGFLKRPEYVERLKSAGIFILPSRFEPFGIVLLEAMAAGVPVVAANTGAVPEILEGGKLGLIFQPGNVDSLTNQLRNILSNESAAKDRAEEARRSLHRYSWQKIAQDTLHTYEEVLSSRK